jgi:hypothetical protein
MDNHGLKIMDCALIALATGVKAQNLRELRDKIKDIHPGSLYHHFWGNLLHPHFDDPEFQNDFAVWAKHDVNDLKIAEKLSIIDPSRFKDLEDLRREVIEILDERLYESEYIPWAKAGHEFHFIRSQTVVFDTGETYEDPRDLLNVIPRMSLGSIFYHFIDSRRRTAESKNDLSVWLASFGDKYQALIEDLDNIDPYFTTLNELRKEITEVFNDYYKVAA